MRREVILMINARENRNVSASRALINAVREILGLDPIIEGPMMAIGGVSAVVRQSSDEASIDDSNEDTKGGCRVIQA